MLIIKVICHMSRVISHIIKCRKKQTKNWQITMLPVFCHPFNVFILIHFINNINTLFMIEISLAMWFNDTVDGLPPINMCYHVSSADCN